MLELTNTGASLLTVPERTRLGVSCRFVAEDEHAQDQ